MSLLSVKPISAVQRKEIEMKKIFEIQKLVVVKEKTVEYGFFLEKLIYQH